VISVYTKKKELIGNFAQDGHIHTQVPIEVLDHDFPSAGEGKLIPHGIIEHRLFPQVTRTCQGVVFHSVAIAKHFMEKAKTSEELKVTVDILTGVCVTGKEVCREFPRNDEYPVR
jgi:hypothetical protein